MKTLQDKYHRTADYLRIAVTDRCNLRCFYCMPPEGAQIVSRQELLTYEEIIRLIKIGISLGIKKVRFTGGEPFVRKDFTDLLCEVARLPGLDDIHLTTNGLLTAPHIPLLKKIGIKTINLSLDTASPEQFKKLTFRDGFEKVIHTKDEALKNGIKIKINAVISAGKNEEDLINLTEFARDEDLEIRFIEEMPFNGREKTDHKSLNYKELLYRLQKVYPEIRPADGASNATAELFQIPGFVGKIGIIAAYSRTFCGTCNRIRLTAKGILRNCLYSDSGPDVLKMMRTGASDDQIAELFLKTISEKAKDGFEAEKQRSGDQISESMSAIGG